MEPKNYKYNTEQLKWTRITHSQCKGCVFAEKDYALNGKVLTEGCDKGLCQKYPKGKPHAISDQSENKINCEFKKVR